MTDPVHPQPAVTGAVARRVLRKLSRDDSVATAAIESVRAEHPAYRMIREPEEIEAINRGAAESVRVFARWVNRGRLFSPEELDFLRLEAVATARRLIPLDVLLQVVRLGQRVLWGWIVRECGETAEGKDAALVLLEELVEFCDRASSIFTESYLEMQLFSVAEEDRLRRDVLEDLLSGRPPSEDIRARVAAFGVRGDRYVVAVATSRPEPEAEALRTIAQAIDGREPHGLVVARHSEVVAVFADLEPAALVRLLEEARRVASGVRGVDLAAGVSTRVSSLGEVVTVYDEAVQALRLAGRHGEPIVTIRSFGVVDYLLSLADDTARRIVPAEVRRLLEEDARADGVLVRTLVAYLESDLNAARVAEVLVVHPNTVHYRLRRIGEVTGRSPRSFRDLLELYAGLLVLDPERARAPRPT